MIQQQKGELEGDRYTTKGCELEKKHLTYIHIIQAKKVMRIFINTNANGFLPATTLALHPYHLNHSEHPQHHSERPQDHVSDAWG